MYLPRTIYELLPWAYAVGGAALVFASWAWSAAEWSDTALAIGAVALVVGIVLLMRRRSYRADAMRYDARSLDDP
jgi:hypothetical protein